MLHRVFFRYPAVEGATTARPETRPGCPQRNNLLAQQANGLRAPGLLCQLPVTRYSQQLRRQAPLRVLSWGLLIRPRSQGAVDGRLGPEA